jgi:tRNA-uridine 2-sulfurtransferase
MDSGGSAENTQIQLHPPTFEPWSPGDRPKRDIAVLMSGGVDSSVTALLLKQAGWNVVGITMKIPVAEKCDYQRSCCGMEAAYVCRDLAISHYYLDVREAFEQLVIEPFRRSYSRGETPSPCVDCNTVFKFGIVWDFIEESLGISRITTGHYARIVPTSSGARLSKAADPVKDQTYFLYGIPRRRLDHLLLPLGDLRKEEVRRIARGSGLQVARRPESMELCFAGEGDYRNALGVQSEEGPILDMQGKVIGRHSGIENYTVGQRRGLGIAAKEPLYVLELRPMDNVLVAGVWDDALKREVSAREANVLIPEELIRGAKVFGKIRSQGEAAPCTVTRADEVSISVEFDEPVFAPTPGQRLVLYNAEGHVVAGGVIC